MCARRATDASWPARGAATRLTLVGALTVAIAAPGLRAQEPPLAAVVARTRAYVAEYQRQLSGIVAEESYVQSFTYRQTFAGKVWVEPSTGRVLMTELIAEGPDIRGVVDVSYELEPKSGLLVPIAMRERYENRDGGTVIEGHATYRGFRRFEVRVDEKIDRVKP
ncbi:MAG: hypothetical protein A3G76_13315 [Acidobacteria bacterium RIFCSPLOWO2_12_FULL_65_11]|nr:MAG: hypothetical protein A3H95_10740 [Acidobacteria bacterium RIFCSPLOWO2_02_FULL_64_15]OFW34031.1 MAG: hypothetical protein A3G76_13315 [Acidobacteria bacterium RIFCSPLOWO2_12_FULL_65_11]